MSQEKSQSVSLTRTWQLNMPQLQWGGLSEHWLLKELGDMHWAMITAGLGTASDKLTDSTGERLYASFVRLRWEGSAALRAFTENEAVTVESRLSRFGSKMFFSEAELAGDGKQLRASLMSVFSARSAQDNTTLKKGSPVLHQDVGIPKHDSLPRFAAEYLAAKEQLVQRGGGGAGRGAATTELAGASFALAASEGRNEGRSEGRSDRWTKEYVIDPFDDVNGVGLLYFASYPKIADRCERLFAHERSLLGEAASDWARDASCVARDIYYFGNANPGEPLSYVQDEVQLLGDGRLGMAASLHRQKDGAMIARIFSVKELTAAVAPDRLVAATGAAAQGREETAAAAGAPPALTAEVEPGAPLPPPAPRPMAREVLRAFVRDFFAAALGLPALDASASLAGLGIDSILYAELAEALHARHGVSVSPARFFGRGSVEALVDEVLGAERAAGDTPRVTGAEAAREDVAIIGCCFRLPGAADRDALWELLRHGRSAIGELPPQRWRWPAAIDPQGEHAGISRGGFVSGIDSFDAGFFRQAPRSAMAMDPQQRWLLEMTWQLLEGAGSSPDAWRGSRTGVYLGASGSDYERLLEPALCSPTGTAGALLANHLSYFYDLRGPSLLLDTACSSSLVALHQAVQAIRHGECDAAITGGVHLMCHPGKTVTYHQSNMLSRSGACRTFDASADGYVRGEGAVLLLLKPLSRARRDRDEVLAVIKGSAVNHGGQVEGLTVPNPEMQAALVVAACRDAGVELATISHIEAHGTGTPLGDPIEVNGLKQAFRASDGGRCSLGSIKPNLGHLEAAAGAAGVVKVLLALAHRELPPLAGFSTLNPSIELEGSPLRVQAQGEAWQSPAPGVPLRAGVSSFGIGGTNAHVIIEEAPPRGGEVDAGEAPSLGEQVGAGGGGPQLFVLSARSERVLRAYAAAMLAHLRRSSSSLAQVAYTSQTARRAMEERLAIVCREREELVAALQAFLDGGAPASWHRGRASGSGDDVALLREEPELLARWLQQGRLELVARYWCRGVEVDWARLHAGRSYPRMWLPTYPFEQARHWIGDAAGARSPVAVPAVAPEVAAEVAAVVAPMAPVAVPVAPMASVAVPVVPVAPIAVPVVALAPDAAHCRQVLISTLAKQLYLEEDEVARAGSFSALGVDSVLGVELAKAVSARLGRKVAASSIYTFATIEALAEHLAAPTGAPAGAALASPTGASTRVAAASGGGGLAPREAGARRVVTLRPPEAWAPRARGTGPLPKVVLAPLPARAPVEPARAPVEPARAPVEPARAPVEPARDAAPGASDEAEALEARLGELLANLLYLERAEVDAERSFSQLGVDSILGVELVKRVSSAFGVPLKAQAIYEHPNLRALAAHLQSRRAGAPPAPPSPPPAVERLASEASASASATGATSAISAASSASSASPSAEVRERVRAMVGEQLYLEASEVGDDQPFGELGLDSVLAADFVKKINAAFATQLKTSELYVYSTVATLSAQLARSLAAASAATAADAPAATAAEAPAATAAGGPAPALAPAARAAGAPAPMKFLAPLRREGDWERTGAATFVFAGSVTSNPYLAGHWVFGRSVMPTDGYLELVYAAICQCTGAQRVSFEAARIHRPFLAGPAAELRVVLQRGAAGAFRFTITSRHGAAGAGEEVVHVRGKGEWAAQPRHERASGEAAATALRSYTAEEIGRALPQTDVIGCYFQGRRALALSADQAWGQLRIDAANGVAQQSHLAQILDGALLFAIQHAAFSQQLPEGSPCLYLPVQLEELDVLREPVGDVTYDCRVRCQAIDAEEARFSLEVCDAAGAVLVRCRRLVLRRIEEARFARGGASEELASDAPVGRVVVEERDQRVAIVGLAGRLPGARDLTELWDVLRDGVDPIEEIDARRWGELSWYHQDPRHAGTSYSRWGGFLADSRGFDPLFFGISPFEAELMTPEQRVFLQECWNALEDGGFDATALARRKVGVFVGAGASDYAQVLRDAGADRDGAVFVGASQAILAARISYLLNLTGPALAIETACSSSLVAIDRAVKSLQSGECELALAGGVALLSTPQLHIWTSQVGMPSPDGRCKTFDDGANGIVSSEGVGVVVLKRLADAERDGDLIRAVIVGSGCNQDGKTNGITAPNAVSQYELIRDLYRERAIDPTTIGYVEAHGTGTKLGDPIEVSALVRAFRELAPAGERREGFCALGSVKSHIGHCSHAAGVSGLLKAVLLLERQQIVPGLHFGKLNDEIELEGSPFYIPTEARPWRDGPGRPRRAAVSSFGFSGTNAHAVLEAYPAARGAALPGPYAVVLSAKHAKALQRRAARLLRFLERDDLRLSMSDLAYTLQLGRAAMESRAAALASDEAALRALLAELASGDERRWKVGQVRQARAAGGPPLRWTERRAPAPSDWDEALARWVTGEPIAWASYYPAGQPRRISLPAYPFAADPYWVGPRPPERAEPVLSANRTGAPAPLAPGSAPRALHPLLHERCAAAEGAAFTSAFTGDEPFLRDHVVGGAKVLAGAAYLELLRVAGAQVTGQAPALLENLIWRAPLTAPAGGCALRVELRPAGEALQAEVKGREGSPVFATATLSPRPKARPPRLALGALRSRLSEHRTKAAHYAALAHKGFALGPSFQGVQERFSDEREVLARVSLPRPAGFALPPGMIDSCLQACLGWAYEVHGLPMALPFSVRELAVFAELPETVWVHARKSPGHDEQGWSGYDVVVADEAGEPCLSCTGFVFLPAQQAPRREREAGLQVQQAEWREAARPRGAGAAAGASLCLLAPELPEALGEELARGGLEVQRLVAGAPAELLWQVLARLQAAAARRQPLSVTVLCAEEELARYRFLSALFKTAALEHGELAGRVLAVAGLAGEPIARLAELVRGEHGAPDVLVRYQGARRLVLGWRACATEEEAAAAPAARWLGLGPGDAVLITGGGGGIGRRLADFLRREVGAVPIVVGRRRSDVPGAISYACDLSSRDEVVGLVRRIEEGHGGLRAVFHLAGLCRDSLLARKTRQEVHEVFAPKVTGALHLDEATRQLRLELFVLFSSIAAVEGNVGQADYAAANAWMDGFAEERARQVRAGQRWGRTLSLNWPLWAEGGMSPDAETLRLLEQRWSMQPMPSEVAWRALRAALASDGAQVSVRYGQAAASSRAGAPRQAPAPAAASESESGGERESTAAIAAAIAAVVSRISKVPAEALDADEELGAYGFDSILLTKLANELNAAFGLSLLPTVFFNHPTLARLTSHLLASHAAELRAAVRPARPAPSAETRDGVAPELAPIAPAAAPVVPAPGAPAAAPLGDEPIAVIGMGGRFPGSPDLDAFWDHLVHERDLITEVPPERWRWQDLYGEAAPYANKTRANQGGFLDGASELDAMFFSISPLEAALMDPQHRLLLETTYHALEDAGLPAQRLRGSDTGVFVGISGTDYAARLKEAGKVAIAQFATGNAHCMAANRLSYWFDWHGPSEPIDTACSSSLVALHRAVASLRRGECALAVAGGVNLLASADLTLSFSQAGMLSGDGRCKTFDSRADGYVRGEGVGMVVLKPLSKALADGDPIHAVIRSSAQNHGGKANTLTSPNPNAQRDLLIAAYAPLRSELHRLCYLEAHGTGTALGDPIEVEALDLAFAKLAEGGAAAAEPCGLGSIKTNIGHLEAAAGIAGFLKLVLVLRHGVVPGNPHLRSANPYLRYDARRLRIETRTRALPAVAWPRLGGVSSFGFGGANAHVVVESFSRPAPPAPGYERGGRPALVPLSGKDGAALERQVARLLAHLEGGRQLDLDDLAYTLQVGRDAHKERALWAVSSLAALRQQLQRWTSAAPGERAALAVRPTALDEVAGGLAGAWLAGEAVTWEALYGTAARPRRISLPGYAFERVPYWISPEPGAVGSQAAGAVAPSPQSSPHSSPQSSPHPLLHRQVSRGEPAIFASELTGTEPFFVDHRVAGEPVLPGAAQLEWVRAAVERLTGRAACCLHEVVFVRPIVPPQGAGERGIAVELRLWKTEQGFRFELGSQAGGALPPQRYSEGRVSLAVRPAAAARFSPEELQRELPQRLSGAAYYELLRHKRIDYRGAFRGIQVLHHDGARALARIETSVEAGCALSPQLLDSAVQAVMGLAFEFSIERPTCLPFSVREVRIHAPLPGRIWSAAQRRSGGSEAALPQLDVQIFDDSGQLLVELEGFTALPLGARQGQAPSEPAPAAASLSELLYLPVWRRAPLSDAPAPRPQREALLITGRAASSSRDEELAAVEALGRALRQRGQAVRLAPELPVGEPAGPLDLYLVQGLVPDAAAGAGGGAELALFRTLKELLARGAAMDEVQVTVLTRGTQAVLPSDAISPDGGGIVGLVGAFQKEQPRWKIRLVDLDAALGAEALSPACLEALGRVPYDRAEVHALRRGRAYQKRLTPLALGAARPTKVRQHGTYVILGGAGGLGRVTTQHLLRRYQANVVWLGRRPHDAAVSSAIRAASCGERAPLYLQCDAVELEQVRAAHRQIRERFGAVHGVFHSALVLADRYVRSMSEQELLQAFAPKAAASEHLVEVFRHEPVDFFCFYSSLQAHVQAAGQGNYAAGCTYGDGLARAAARRHALPVHIIHWGYWGDVGVVAAEDYRARVAAQGLGSISPDEGMAVLESVLSSDLREVTAARFINQ